MEAWAILLPAFCVGALMIVTHAYLGLHVLSRGIIFIDLALAQMAALGLSVAFLFGEEAHGTAAQLYAFGATLLAAIAFAKLRDLQGKTVREVTIGCVYVVATALSIVILSRSAQGMEELKAMFNGNVLWVRWSEIAVLAVAYAAVALLHVIFQKRFYALSFDDGGPRPGYLWEFLFFASFAIIITLAVNVAGILLVFAFLIIPAFSASMLAGSFHGRLVVAWAFGIIGSLLGLWLSYIADLPTGATVVSVFGAFPLVAVVLRAVTGRRQG